MLPGRHLVCAGGALLASAGLIALSIPAAGGAADDVGPSVSAASLLRKVPSGPVPSGPAPSGQAFTGVSAVGALFPDAGGHFCTASVVHSPAGDLAVTAAHCVSGRGAAMVFVPGFHDGQAPYGTWRVTRVYTDAAWQASADPDD